jgi:hypothetical protein
LPTGKTTLLGGRVARVDHLRDRLTLEVFGGGSNAVLFDERTQVLRNGQRSSLDDLKPGERVYVDTMLDGTQIFARSIRVVDSVPMGESSGQIVAFDSSKGILTVRDRLAPDPVKMRVAAGAIIDREQGNASVSDLLPGALVNLAFSPGAGDMATVRRITILAAPGAAFVFSGRLEFLDLHRALLVVVDPRDNKSYEVSLEKTPRSVTETLRQGSNVMVQASFDGKSYQAQDIKVLSQPQ